MPISVGYVIPHSGKVRVVSEGFHYGSQAESLKLLFRLFRELGPDTTFEFAETHGERGEEGISTLVVLAPDEKTLMIWLKGPKGYEGAFFKQEYTNHSLYLVYELDISAKKEPNFDVVLDIMMSHRLRMNPILLEGTFFLTEMMPEDYPEGEG